MLEQEFYNTFRHTGRKSEYVKLEMSTTPVHFEPS